ncbi:MAG: serine/threonine protein kinase, partial [Lentisphaeria bacterium]|nr:serine/threonine protein kinase [Lentisphaeria bacterium]
MRFQCHNCTQIVAIDNSESGQPVGCGSCGQILIVPDSKFAQYALINDFVIQHALGKGGMGTVYLAHQLSLDRPVALKILMEQFSSNSEFIVDFVREARSAARLNHPNIVQSYAVGEDEGIYYFAMEYVEGKTLKTLLDEKGKLVWQEAIKIIQQIAEALDFAWKQVQLVHRDIKPDNIMLTERGEAKLADLGLARAASETMDDDDEVMGTPQYICPEQLLGQPMDVRGDIYSLGATLYHTLTGHFPFEGNTASEIARKHLNDPVPDPRQFTADVPEEATFIIRKMMAKKLENRYDDAEELVMDLGFVLRGQQPAGYQEGKGPNKGKGKTGKAKSQTTTGRKNVKKTGAFQSPSSARGSSQVPAAKSKTGVGMQKADRRSGKSKLKTGGKPRPKSKSVVQQRPRPGDPTSGAYQRPGAQPKNNTGLKVFLIIILTIIVTTSALTVFTYQRYNFKSPNEAKAFYLQHVCLDPERDDYKEIETYQYQDPDCDKIHDAWKKTDAFITKYPSSMFVFTQQSRDSVLFKIPMEMDFFAKKIPPQTTELKGSLIRQRDNLEEVYTKCLRKFDNMAEKVVILQNRSDFLFNQIKTDAISILEEESRNRRTKIEGIQENVSAKVDADRARFEEEKKELRLTVMEKTANCEFVGAIDIIKKALEMRERYNISVLPTVEEVTGKEETAFVDPLISRIKNKFKVEYPDKRIRKIDVDELNLEDVYKKFEDDNEILKLRTAVDELASKQTGIFESRNKWLKKFKSAMEIAQKYHNRIADTKKRFSWSNTKYYYKKIHMHKIKNTNTDKVRISSIMGKEVIFEVLTYNSDAELVPKQPLGTERYPIYDFALFNNPKDGVSLIEQLINYDIAENDAAQPEDLPNE